MVLDRSGTNLKGPRSLSNQFGRFFDQKFRSDTLAGHLKPSFVQKVYFKVSSQSFQSKISDQKIVQIDLKDFLDP